MVIRLDQITVVTEITHFLSEISSDLFIMCFIFYSPLSFVIGEL